MKKKGEELKDSKTTWQNEKPLSLTVLNAGPTCILKYT